MRDKGFLFAAGVASSNLHEIPNPVSKLAVGSKPAERPFAKGKQFVLYPTRGIRRKNIGELLLHAMIHRDSKVFATTLSPENPEWLGIHDRWRELAKELELPVTLGISDSNEYQFEELIGWSDVIITTSIAEGFGLAFLEPWLAGKSVVGRNLPRITRDFAEKGLDLGHLYSRINVPIDWLNKDKVKESMNSALRQSYLAYDKKLPKDAVDRAWNVWVVDGKVDFGLLSEDFQTEILRGLERTPAMLSEIEAPSIEPRVGGEISDRKNLVEQLYSIESYGERLHGIYKRINNSSSSKVSSLSTGKVLDQFLAPEG